MWVNVEVVATVSNDVDTSVVALGVVSITLTTTPLLAVWFRFVLFLLWFEVGRLVVRGGMDAGVVLSVTLCAMLSCVVELALTIP